MFILVFAFLLANGAHGVGFEMNDDHRSAKTFNSKEECMAAGDERMKGKSKEVVWAQGFCWPVPIPGQDTPAAPQNDRPSEDTKPRSPSAMPDRT